MGGFCINALDSFSKNLRLCDMSTLMLLYIISIETHLSLSILSLVLVQNRIDFYNDNLQVHRVRVFDKFAVIVFFHEKSKFNSFILLSLAVKRELGDRESCCISRDLSFIEVSANSFDGMSWASRRCVLRPWH